MSVTRESLSEEIASLADEPEELEKLYRTDEAKFTAAFPDAVRARPDAILLRAWQVRLGSRTTSEPESTNRTLFWFVVALCALAILLVKLPSIIHGIDEGQYYVRDPAFFFLPAITAYFIGMQRPSWRRVFIVAVLFSVAAIAINLYPERSVIKHGPSSDSVALACLALPLFLWSIAGFVFAGDEWRETDVRVAFLRLNGEAIINFALIIITGGILTGTTMALFAAIKVDISNWYLRWVVASGAVSAPIVAVHLAIVRARRATLAPLLARIFSPLSLATLVFYLGAMIWARRNPYSDREFLLVFNVMLVSVLAIAIFGICERKPNAFSDFTILALVFVAVIIDAVALSAIALRLSDGVFTPNRVVTLGTNVIMLVNLLGILITFFKTLRAREIEARATKRWIAQFLPVYTAWTVVILFVLPPLFRFR